MEGIDMEQGLARWPRGGNRRRLEDSWLRELERRGLPSHLPDPPAGASTALQQAIVEFNSGAFWECHETLEEIWLETAYPPRFFYHAIIKVAVGFHHTSRRNRHGARVKLSDGVRLLRLFVPSFLGVRTDHLLGETAVWLARLDGSERVDWSELDGLARPAIQTTER